MWTSAVDGSDQRPVGDQRGWYMEWSTDRDRLLFDRMDSAGDNQIWTVNPDGSDLRQLTTEPVFNGDGDLSPDDRTVVYTRAPTSPESGGTGTLWLMAADGSDARSLIDPTGDGDDWQPSFSPDGSQVLFTREFANGESSLFVVDVDGSDVRQLTAPEVYTEHARWSPDGSRVIYNIEYADDLDDPRNGIWTVPVSGGPPTMLLATDDRFHVFKPDYSPDGSRIVFGCLDRVEGQEDICVMDADGSDVQKVTDTPDFENHPVWR